MDLRQLLGEGSTRTTFVPSPGTVAKQLSPLFGEDAASLLTSLAKQIDETISTGVLGAVLPMEMMLAISIVYASSRRMCLDASENPKFNEEARTNAKRTLDRMTSVVGAVDAPEPEQRDVDDILDTFTEGTPV